MATEVWAEQVAAALKTSLESIVADAVYWYTPDVVERTHEITRLLTSAESKTVVYALAPFEVEITENAGRQAEMTLTIDFMLARKHLSTDEPFQAKTPIRWTVQNRLFTDFARKILNDAALIGNIVDNIDFRFVQMNAEAVFLAGWAVVIGQIAPRRQIDTVTML